MAGVLSNDSHVGSPTVSSFPSVSPARIAVIGRQKLNVYFVSNPAMNPCRTIDVGHIQAQTLLLDTSYGLTDTIALDLSVPYVTSKYTGSRPHPSVLDDGAYHATFQDVRFALRYNLRPGRFAVTPFVGTIVPSHDYEYYAHSAAGRRLREVQIGTYVAKLLDPVVPGAFVQARYSYGIAQRVLDIAHNRSNAEVEAGYFVASAVRVFALGAGQLTHGGIDTPYRPDLSAPDPLTPEQRIHHDQISRVNFLSVGGGASVSLNESVDVFASIMTQVAGRNGHALSRGINLGMTWSFKRQHGSASPTTAQTQASSLVRCLCQKGDL